LLQRFDAAGKIRPRTDDESIEANVDLSEQRKTATGAHGMFGAWVGAESFFLTILLAGR